MLDNELDVNMDNEVDSSATETQEIEQQPTEPSQEPVEAAPKQDSEANVPFHLHPRFQEVISQKNELAEQNKAFARQMQEMQQQLQQMRQPAPQQDAVMERLKKIDPEFAERFGKINEVDEIKKQLAEFQEYRQQSAQRETQAQLSSMKDKFYSENNVPSERRAIYDAMVQSEAAKDPNLKITDLPKVMKSVHDNLDKMFKTVQRETTKQFVDTKKATASKPSSQPRGTPVKPGKGNNEPTDRATARQQVIKDIMSDIKAGKEI